MKKVLSALTVTMLAGCSAVQPVEQTSQQSSLPKQSIDVTIDGMSIEERDAYRRGVNETLHELRGRIAVQRGQVFQPPIRECGIQVPGQFIGGAYVMAHETCVTIAPGHYVTKESVYGVEGDSKYE